MTTVVFLGSGSHEPFGGDMHRPISINASSIPVAGIGGLGMLAIAALMAEEFPLVRLVCLMGGTGGILVGVALILRRRHEGRLSN